MSPLPSKHPFDEWFERGGASPEKREHALAAWNAVIGAAMTTAVHMRDAFVIAGEYEDGAMARDIAEMIGKALCPRSRFPVLATPVSAEVTRSRPGGTLSCRRS